MRMICWNCRGLEGPSVVREVKDLVRSFRPSVLALIEKKVCVKKWNVLRVKLGYLNCFTVNRVGLSGGLAVLWHEEVDIQIQSFSRWHINMLIKGEQSFRASIFYGHPVGHKRKGSWELLRSLKGNPDEAWAIMGDFNETLFGNESRGGRPRDRGRMRNFRGAAQECGPVDMGFKGVSFTFSNRGRDHLEVRVRLDRVMATQAWRQMFPNLVVKHGPAYRSDHCPLLIGQNREVEGTSKNQFRFEAMWCSYPGFAEVVKGVWRGAEGSTRTLPDMLKGCAQGLKTWNKTEFGHVQGKIKDLREQIDKSRSLPRTSVICYQEQHLIRELDEWLWREEVMWSQRSRVQWIREGDRNSAFFHAKASRRKKTNTIARLLDRNGESQNTREGMKQVVEQYFNRMFESQIDSENIDWRAALDGVERKVSDEMNAALLAPVLEDEIKQAVFQMHPTKAPGLDGFPALFFQKYWRLVGQRVCQLVSSVINGEGDVQTLNVTKIVLIPKKAEAVEMQHFRPISLCNVLMRVVSKVITNRLKGVIPQIISEAQSAFIPGRLISDNILIAHELSHYIKSRKGNGEAFILVKLDMCKAYDKMEWIFMEKMMLKLGFSEAWTNMVMRCVRSVSYVVGVNDQVTEVITPARGLRQGDPLSPYLFIIGSEWLSRSLERGVQCNKMSGLRVSRSSPSVSHLLFADDSLIFCRARTGDVEFIKRTLEDYELLSGQQISREKSKFVYSPNMGEDQRRHIETLLEMESVEEHGRYLGLPMIIGARKSEMFKDIEEKTSKRILSWSSNLLSLAGREVLIKAVLSAMPQFAMTCFKLPVSLCERLQKLAISFWWSGAKNGRSIHWVSRHSLMKEKMQGGLGFRDLKVLNDVFLIKQAWRMLSCPELLMSRVLKGRYFPNCGILEAGGGTRPSHAWRGIFKVRHWLVEGLRNWDGVGEPAWGLEDSGTFSVKGTYKYITQRLSQGEQSDGSRVQRFWKKVWRTNAPNRVKLMVWRLFLDALPDAVNLRKRGCDINTSCRFCGYQEESAMHSVRDCWRAVVFWQRVIGGGTWEAGVGMSAADWLFRCATVCDVAEFRVIMIGVWVMWNGRNAFIYEQKEWSINEMIMKVQSTVYQADKYMGRELVLQIPNAIFSPRDMGNICFFCDASWGPSRNDAGLAAVWVCGGYIQAINFKWVESFVGGKDSEGEAVLLGMLLAERLKLRDVIFISDSLVVVQAIGLGFDQQAGESNWLEECMRLQITNPGWSVKHAMREENYIADAVARFARSSKSSWLDPWSIPRCVGHYRP